VRSRGWLVGPLIVTLVAVLAGPPIAARADAGVDISATEGQPFSGRVLSIDCAFLSGTIEWGDGTTSAGRDASPPPGVAGDHTYAEEGTYAGTVSYLTDCNSRLALTQHFRATVSDAALSAVGRNQVGTAGQAVGDTVAHFTDANPAANAADLSAQIQWGDGSASAGAVTKAVGSGFDVAGTHSYASAGTYQISTKVIDLGGSTTNAGSTAQIAAAPQPLSPPFNFSLAVPTAMFRFSPMPPCQSQHVSFDASGSTGESSSGGGSLPITQYRWTFDESAFAPTVVLTAAQILDHPFLPSSYGPGPYEGSGPNPRGDLFDYRFFRPPAIVTLDVTDSAGKTASVSERITFHDPVRVIPEIVPIDPQTGLPDFAHPHVNRNDPRFKHAIPCAKLRTFDLVPSAKLKLGEVKLAAAYAAVRPSRASIAVKAPCARGPVNCFGELIVTVGPKARVSGALRKPGSLAKSLGHTTFFVGPGRTARVTVMLSARGRALIRARGLRSVILALRTPRSSGKFVTTTRAVPLHFLP
jgi:hypothetical protein